jgi:hypothetical protein
VSNYRNLILQKKEQEAREKARQDNQNLHKKISKKLITTGVGSIASIEKHSGFLFGHGERRSLTAEESFIKSKVDNIRTEILDNAHRQIKHLEEDLKQYTIVYNGYFLNLPIYKGRKKNENNTN